MSDVPTDGWKDQLQACGPGTEDDSIIVGGRRYYIIDSWTSLESYHSQSDAGQQLEDLRAVIEQQKEATRPTKRKIERKVKDDDKTEEEEKGSNLVSDEDDHDSSIIILSERPDAHDFVVSPESSPPLTPASKSTGWDTSQDDEDTRSQTGTSDSEVDDDAKCKGDMETAPINVEKGQDMTSGNTGAVHRSDQHRTLGAHNECNARAQQQVLDQGMIQIPPPPPLSLVNQPERQVRQPWTEERLPSSSQMEPPTRLRGWDYPTRSTSPPPGSPQPWTEERLPSSSQVQPTTRLRGWDYPTRSTPPPPGSPVMPTMLHQHKW